MTREKALAEALTKLLDACPEPHDVYPDPIGFSPDEDETRHVYNLARIHARAALALPATDAPKGGKGTP
jgi:hypothetical protein